MTTLRSYKLALAVILVAALAGSVAVVGAAYWDSARKTRLVAYFDNSNGVFPGDEVRILGVRVGQIESIEPQPDRAKISFWVSDKYRIPADARAVILSPQLVTARALQLTPAYTGGPVMTNNTVIPQDRTAVPVEWDDVRLQLEKLTEALQPTQPGGVSTLGAYINTAAENLRGEGANIRNTVVQMSQAFSALGDHSGDLYSTVKNLSVLVSALQSSGDLMAQLNHNLAAVTGLLVDDPGEVGQAVNDLNTAVGDVQRFVADNRETLGTTTDTLTSVTEAVVESMPDIKQSLHVAPTAAANLSNIYQPAQATLSGALAVNNLSNPIDFICSAVQAASRMGAEQAAKLCVQYLAPIVKNRQFNFPPLGLNPVVGTQARPNEITYSEDWLRPDFTLDEMSPSLSDGRPALPQHAAPLNPQSPELQAKDALSTLPSGRASPTPADGLPGLLLPHGGGS